MENNIKEEKEIENNKEEEDLELKESKEGLEECQRLAKEYLAGWQRARADFLNYKKEEKERMKDFLKYLNMEFILKILPTLDNFEITEKKMPEGLRDDGNVKGLLQIKNQILDFLKSQGVEEIKAIGEKFNPNFHEVIEEVSPSEASAKEGEFSEPGIIIEEVQKGYLLNDKVIRPAKVKVSK
ncbi:MAG: nucleotide exchange factor GrpE [Candidatus Nealsonbacteria bacterium RBG_13_36_15]|uniref:Protein GrpE n=1 Tax=Candidatus Nealsonbacteria bacterium RBG_13_36_15 TaxID=1801660 RepID=A0A1G2DY00_9BACT|nr:MAG: nucleotide exchange factor GrpE [Candidatus Nealsonbacteria bacterium RBG_13_36_15]